MREWIHDSSLSPNEKCVEVKTWRSTERSLLKNFLSLGVVIQVLHFSRERTNALGVFLVQSVHTHSGCLLWKDQRCHCFINKLFLADPRVPRSLRCFTQIKSTCCAASSLLSKMGYLQSGKLEFVLLLVMYIGFTMFVAAFWDLYRVLKKYGGHPELPVFYPLSFTISVCYMLLTVLPICFIYKTKPKSWLEWLLISLQIVMFFTWVTCPSYKEGAVCKAYFAFPFYFDSFLLFPTATYWRLRKDIRNSVQPVDSPEMTQLQPLSISQDSKWMYAAVIVVTVQLSITETLFSGGYLGSWIEGTMFVSLILITIVMAVDSRRQSPLRLSFSYLMAYLIINKVTGVLAGLSVALSQSSILLGVAIYVAFNVVLGAIKFLAKIMSERMFFPFQTSLFHMPFQFGLELFNNYLFLSEPDFSWRFYLLLCLQIVKIIAINLITLNFLWQRTTEHLAFIKHTILVTLQDFLCDVCISIVLPLWLVWQHYVPGQCSLLCDALGANYSVFLLVVFGKTGAYLLTLWLTHKLVQRKSAKEYVFVASQLINKFHQASTTFWHWHRIPFNWLQNCQSWREQDGSLWS